MTDTTTAARARPAPADSGGTTERRRWSPYSGYLFILPVVGLLLVFQFYPIVNGFWLSLHEWDGLSPTRPYVGFANYGSVLSDPIFWGSLKNAIIYGVATVLVGGCAGLVMALVVNSKRHLGAFFRAIFFLPWMLSPVVFGYLWLWILDPTIGPINKVLGFFAGHEIYTPWLTDPTLAFWTVTAVFIWCHWGFGFLIFLSGLQDVPGELLEAASLDGATAFQRFRKIIWPLLMPITIVVSIVSMLLAMKIFATVLIMTNGGPGYATQVPTVLIYQEAFKFHRVGRSAAISMVFAVFMVLLSIIQLLLGRRSRT